MIDVSMHDVQGPLSRFGDTAANAGMLALLEVWPCSNASYNNCAIRMTVNALGSAFCKSNGFSLQGLFPHCIFPSESRIVVMIIANTWSSMFCDLMPTCYHSLKESAVPCFCAAWCIGCWQWCVPCGHSAFRSCYPACYAYHAAHAVMSCMRCSSVSAVTWCGTQQRCAGSELGRDQEPPYMDEDDGCIRGCCALQNCTHACRCAQDHSASRGCSRHERSRQQDSCRGPLRAVAWCSRSLFRHFRGPLPLVCDSKLHGSAFSVPLVLCFALWAGALPLSSMLASVWLLAVSEVAF